MSKIDANYLVPGLARCHCLVVSVSVSERIILWLKLNDQLFLSWLFDFSRVFEPFNGFKVCSLFGSSGLVVGV